MRCCVCMQSLLAAAVVPAQDLHAPGCSAVAVGVGLVLILVSYSTLHLSV